MSLKLSILIPSIGEPSSHALFYSILAAIKPHPDLRDGIELLMYVSGIHKPLIFDPAPPDNAKMFSNKDRLGASESRNELALGSRGTHILFCDADSYIHAPQLLADDLKNVLKLIANSGDNWCYILHKSAGRTLSPFFFRLTEWNFLISKKAFLKLKMFPQKIGVGSSSMAQSGEAQFLFNAMYQSGIKFWSIPILFGHPTLGSRKETVDLMMEKKLYRYNYGATFSTFVMLSHRFSLLSLAHFISHLASTIVLLFALPLRFRPYTQMIRGRFHGFIESLTFNLSGEDLLNLYGKQ